MVVLLTGKTNGYAQFIAVLIVFLLVLAVTAFTTKWMADYQKQQKNGANIELLEATRISNNKYIQLVKVGEVFFAIAVCKDTVTLLGEIPKEQIICTNTGNRAGFGFKDLFDKALAKKDMYGVDIKENQSDEEE